MKTFKYTSLLLCIPLMYACKSHPALVNKNEGIDTIPVQTLPLKQQNNNAAMNVSGQFTTDDEVMLSFKTGGIINSLHVKEGDAVKKGQLLATLNLTEIDAQVQQANLSVEKAQRDYQRIQNLYKDSVATLEQLQNSKTTLQQAQQQWNMTKYNRQYSEIHAPKDGYILRKMANAGQLVAAGAAVLQTNGAETSKWILRVGISDNEWARLQLNDRAQIQTTALPGQQLQGVISRKSEGVDAVTGTFSADITLDGKKVKGIAAGMFGKAVITPSRTSVSGSEWQIPYEALLDGDGTAGYVFITNDNKTAHKVKVAVAGINKNTVTISAGLEDVKALIISGSAYLTDNGAIVVQSPKTASK